MIHFFTVGNDISKAEHLMKSAEMFNVHVHFIDTKTWSGYYDKIRYMKEAIKDLPSDSIICFMDGYDVLVTGDAEEIMTKFKEFNCDLVFSSELNCWPGEYLEKYPPGTRRFLNSGGYIGKQHALMDLFNWRTPEQIEEKCKAASDQGYCAEYYLETGKIVLDLQSRIFQSMYFISWDEIQFVYGRPFNTVMKQSPCFLHFNGNAYQTADGKNGMPVFIDKMAKSADSDTPVTLQDVKANIQSWNKPRSQL